MSFNFFYTLRAIQDDQSFWTSEKKTLACGAQITVVPPGSCFMQRYSTLCLRDFSCDEEYLLSQPKCMSYFPSDTLTLFFFSCHLWSSELKCKIKVLWSCISLLAYVETDWKSVSPEGEIWICFLLCRFRRLAKSTLLLIPLFGMNFIVFAFIPEQVKTELRLVFDLILGSFQVRYQLFKNKCLHKQNLHFTFCTFHFELLN